MTHTAYGKYQQEPVWRPKNQLLLAHIPNSLKAWLFDQTSLTKRLQDWCPGKFQVRLYRQARQRPMLNETRCLDLPASEHALIRQVHLFCDDQALVFARTVIPPHSLVGKQRRLAQLGQRSLGAVLFADKSMQRSELEVTRIAPKQMLYRDAQIYSKDPQRVVWGRRSVFTLHGHPLLVSEFFLAPIVMNVNETRKTSNV